MTGLVWFQETPTKWENPFILIDNAFSLVRLQVLLGAGYNTRASFYAVTFGWKLEWRQAGAGHWGKGAPEVKKAGSWALVLSASQFCLELSLGMGSQQYLPQVWGEWNSVTSVVKTNACTQTRRALDSSTALQCFMLSLCCLLSAGNPQRMGRKYIYFVDEKNEPQSGKVT